MDVSGDAAKGFIAVARRWRGAITRHGSVFWLYIHRDVSRCDWTNDVKLRISFDNFVDMPMHGHLLGENNEEDSFRRGSKL